MYWGYVIVGYVVVFGGMGVYAATLIARGRQLSKRVPPDRRRFLD